MIPRNPFSSLVKIRSVREQRARADLGRANLVQQDALDRLEEMKRQFSAGPGIPPSLNAVQLRALQLTGVTEHERLVAAADALEEATRHAGDRAARWRASAGELDAAERLDQRKKEQAAHSAAKATERAMDDLLVTIRHRRRSR